ncbi:hypothetical protein [Lewinella sp. 4G2]|uniref:hypothetical protein n=1 Tax=Lewinella sp. 4G2 TaxID=1803372 RepID=UPI0007B463A4|nr:hypothetical protein [Lewinella sp. 4G2]OAV43932.1 hypothetical protein A3850_005240 [Lewinella sp. 4G2]
MPHPREVKDRINEACRQVFDRQSARAARLSRISAEEKAFTLRLVEALVRIQRTDPFPELAEPVLVELATLSQLPGGGGTSVTAEVPDWLGWANRHFPVPDLAPAAAPEMTSIVPGNVRMIRNLHRFKTAATRARLRLLRAGDGPDATAYKTARNAYTLARAAYLVRLESNDLTASVEDNVAFETDFLAALIDITGADLPELMSAAAEFARDRVFAPATFVA